MNSIDNLITEYGICEVNAIDMLDRYKAQVGTIHGDYTIVDIDYIGNGNKNYKFVCNVCGSAIEKVIGVTRLRDISKRCSACKETEKQEKANLKILKKQKSLEAKQQKQDIVAQKQQEKEFAYQKAVGNKYNRLLVLDIRHINKRVYAFCECECGNTKEIQIHNVIRGITKSCGCLAKEISDNAITNSPLYNTWNSMKQRCLNPNSNAYADYGGRGITVCQEWINSFRAFEEWAIENEYQKDCGLTLDRIDVNKGYCPENCRWSNVPTQLVNQRKRKGKYCVDGIYKTKKEWCDEYGVWTATVDYRMKHMNMTFEEALKASKVCEGNHYATGNKIKNPNRKKQEATDALNECKTYIEANLLMHFQKLETQYKLIPQFRVMNYHVDFLVEGTNIIIECDGYDWHKSKEQVTSDCKRQRCLTTLGYKVIRFSGQEINNNPVECAKEILEIIIAENEVIYANNI